MKKTFPALRSIEGETYNLLTAIRLTRKEGSSRYWLFRCACGNEKEIQRGSVVSGTIKSCGCLKRAGKHGNFKRPDTGSYDRWRKMIKRCYDADYKDFRLYGSRGISVCDRWRKSMVDFISDMGSRPSPSHSIDRIDNNGNYEPGNCRWALPTTQGNNRRSNRIIEHAGESITMTEWSRRLGGCDGLVKSRIRLGWSEVESITRKLS